MHIHDVCVYRLWWRSLRQVVLVVAVSCNVSFILLKRVRLFVYLGDLRDWSWWFLDILVAFCGGESLFFLGCWLWVNCYGQSYWFSKNVSNLRGGVLLFLLGCFLLRYPYDWSYWFWKNVSNLHGGVLLCGVGYLLLCGRYDCSYRFPGC